MRYGTIEYRRYEKQLVAYDTALGAVQWTAPMESATFSIRNAVPDRLLDTGTLEVPGTDPDDRDARVGPVADLDATIETLELPVRTPLAPSVIRPHRICPAARTLFSRCSRWSRVQPNNRHRTADRTRRRRWTDFLLPVVLMIWVALRRM